MAVPTKHHIGLHTDSAQLFLGRVKCIGRLVHNLDHGTRETCPPAVTSSLEAKRGNCQIVYPLEVLKATPWLGETDSQSVVGKGQKLDMP